MLPGPPRECVALTAKRGLGGARRTPAPVSRAARRPYIIHCQTGPRAACAGGSLCAWHLADCSSHVASLPLHGFAGCDPSPCLPGGGGPEVQRMGRLAFSSQQGLKATGLDPAALSHLLTMEGRDSPGEGLGGTEGKPLNTRGRQRTGWVTEGLRKAEGLLHPGPRPTSPSEPPSLEKMLPAMGGSWGPRGCWLCSSRGSVCSAVKWGLTDTPVSCLALGAVQTRCWLRKWRLPRGNPSPEGYTCADAV